MPPLPVSTRFDFALRGILFLLVVVATIVLAFTPVGDAINHWQAGWLGGSYNPKLTIVILILFCTPPAIILYFLLRWLGR
jgi:hypothetical protein